jgi:hypothetical protein
MDIHLETDDFDLLYRTVERQLSSLREELVRTDDRDYRRGLREDINRLEALVQRLTEARRVPTSDAETDPVSP